MLFTLVLVAALGFAIYRGYLFVDFQFQVGSFIWGKRLGTKRRSGITVVTAPPADTQ